MSSQGTLITLNSSATSLLKKSQYSEQEGKSSHELIREYPFTFDESKYSVVRFEPRKTIADESILPTGKDNGKGPAELMDNYVDHVLLATKHPQLQHIARKEFFSENFNEGDFDFKLSSIELQSIPLQSQICRQRSIFPTNSKDQKKFFVILTEKLKRDDPSIVRLRLSGMNINDFVLSQICSGLIRNRWVQILLLHRNKITDKGMEMLCHALQYHPHCHSIWLASNRITDVGMRHIAELLHWNHHLKELNVSNSWPSEISAKKEYEMHPHITYAGAEFLARYLRKGAGLTSLSLADQRLRDDGASILFELISDYPLRSLNLSGNQLGDKCCRVLRNILPQNPILEELILSRNNITSTGAVDIACGLSYNHLITILDLANNQIADAGLYALYKCLQYNTTIRSLITVGNIRNSKKVLETNKNRKDGNKMVIAKTRKPFARFSEDGWDDQQEDDHPVDDDFHEDSHGQYELHAEALAARRNRNSMVAFHPGNPMEGETPNRHASFAVLTAIHEEAQETTTADSLLVGNTPALVTLAPTNTRELRASLSIPRHSSETGNEQMQLTSVTSSSPERSNVLMNYRAPRESFDAMIASPFMRRSVLVQQEQQQRQRTPSQSSELLTRSPSIVASPQQQQQQRRNTLRSSLTGGMAPLVAVPGVSAHGKRGLTRSITTAPPNAASFSLSPPRGSPGPRSSHVEDATGNNLRPFTAPAPAAVPSTAAATYPVSIEEAIAQAIRNVNEAPSNNPSPRSIGHMSTEDSIDHRKGHYQNIDSHSLEKKALSNKDSGDHSGGVLKTDNHQDDDEHSVHSAISDDLSLASSIDDMVSFRQQRQQQRRGQNLRSSRLLASSTDDCSTNSNGSNYRRKSRAMSINPFTLTPHEMKDYFDGKITYNPYRDEMKKRREDEERKVKADKEAQERQQALRHRSNENGGDGGGRHRAASGEDDKISPLSRRPSSSSSHGSNASLSSSVDSRKLQNKPQRRLSQDLGKTLGVPHFQSIGIKPIRSSISEYGDSGQHLMYLRIATEDDPVDARPTSLVRIGLDRERERANLKKQRQTPQYKSLKAGLLEGSANNKGMNKKKKKDDTHAKVHTVPDTFWKYWDVQLRSQYPKGIDRTPGCVSTKLETIEIPPPPRDVTEPDPYVKYDRDNPQSSWNRYLEYMRRPELKYQRHLHFNETQVTPGQVLAARRKEQLARRMAGYQTGGGGASPPPQDDKDSDQKDQEDKGDGGEKNEKTEDKLLPSPPKINSNATIEQLDSVPTSPYLQFNPGNEHTSTSHHLSSHNNIGERKKTKLPHVSRVKLPASVEAKLHSHTYAAGHLEAVHAAHLAVDGPAIGNDEKYGKKRGSVADASRLRRISATAFALTPQQRKKGAEIST